MQGAVFRRPFGRIAGVPKTRPGLGEAVAVRLPACASDLHLCRSAPGSVSTSGQVIMGHEPSGVVHTVGPGVPDDIAAVGDMIHRRTGWPQICTMALVRDLGTHEHGGHAAVSRFLLPHGPLDNSLSFAADSNRLRYRHGRLGEVGRSAVACSAGPRWD
jgi:hypothetical protein